MGFSAFGGVCTKKVITMRQKRMLLGGGYYIPTEVWKEDNRIYFEFPFNRPLMDEIKAMEGKRWHPEEKIWSCLDTVRNEFALAYLDRDKEDPYDRFDKAIPVIKTTRPLWTHQHEMLGFIMSRNGCLLAAEQGTGKSLPLIESMERHGFSDNEIWYVSTKAGLEAMKLELEKWESPIQPTMFTFEGLKKPYSGSFKGWTIPKYLILDESSRLKTHNTARSRAAQYVANAIRLHWGDKGYVVECTGTPAPHSPVDWWKQCEIAWPGFIKEGTAKIFQSTMAMMEYVESETGSYPHLVTWWDDKEKCKKCGQIPKTTPCNRPDCNYEPSVNEMERFYERAQGLVLVLKKEDCLDLPDKFYRAIRCTPTDKLKALAKIVLEEKETKIEVLSALRCLSDGHEYCEEIVGEKVCPICKGVGEAENYVTEDDYEDEFESMGEVVTDTCWMCLGDGRVPRTRRTYTELDSPKLDVMSDLLGEHQDVGRIIVYAAYHASIDRIEKLCLSKGWTVLKVDGRGWYGITPSGDKIDKSNMVKTFQQKPGTRSDITQKVAWVAHPQSSGTGLTLTESPTEVFFSNSFSADARLQAEDRAHRPGMDLKKGLTVIDIINLETDSLIFDNLSNKRWLQDLTLGRIKERLELSYE